MIERIDVYLKDYKTKAGKYLGTVPERRKEPRRKRANGFDSMLTYARKVFGRFVKDPNAIYIVPRKEDIK